MTNAYLDRIDLANATRVLDLGCGAADAQAIALPDASFDAVMAHTLYIATQG